MAKYIDQKKGEAMSKAKVGEIQGAVTGDCPVSLPHLPSFVLSFFQKVTNSFVPFFHLSLFFLSLFKLTPEFL